MKIYILKFIVYSNSKVMKNYVDLKKIENYNKYVACYLKMMNHLKAYCIQSNKNLFRTLNYNYGMQ